MAIFSWKCHVLTWMCLSARYLLGKLEAGLEIHADLFALRRFAPCKGNCYSDGDLKNDYTQFTHLIKINSN